MPTAIAAFPSVVRRLVFWLAMLALAVLAGCASRPINEPISHVDRRVGYRLETRAPYENEDDTLIILAFSGGGTRAAAFAYGVLEELRRTEVDASTAARRGCSTRSTSSPACRAAASPHSPTACTATSYSTSTRLRSSSAMSRANSCALPQSGELDRAVVGRLGPLRDGRAALRRDPVPRRDVRRPADMPGPLIIATATDISTGSRLGFTQSDFDILCSDLTRSACRAPPRRRPRYRSCCRRSRSTTMAARAAQVSDLDALFGGDPQDRAVRRAARCIGSRRCSRSRTAEPAVPPSGRRRARGQPRHARRAGGFEKIEASAPYARQSARRYAASS